MTPAFGDNQGTPFYLYPTAPDQYTSKVSIWADDLVGYAVGFDNASPTLHKGVHYGAISNGKAKTFSVRNPSECINKVVVYTRTSSWFGPGDWVTSIDFYQRNGKKHTYGKKKGPKSKTFSFGAKGCMQGMHGRHQKGGHVANHIVRAIGFYYNPNY